MDKMDEENREPPDPALLAPTRKRRSESRRSSILKKSPFRNTTEASQPTCAGSNSPIHGSAKKTRLSRRVSFAETFQVKEFTDVWQPQNTQVTAEDKSQQDPIPISGLDKLLKGPIQNQPVTDQRAQINGAPPMKQPPSSNVKQFVQSWPNMSISPQSKANNEETYEQLYDVPQDIPNELYRGNYHLTNTVDFSTVVNTGINKISPQRQDIISNLRDGNCTINDVTLMDLTNLDITVDEHDAKTTHQSDRTICFNDVGMEETFCDGGSINTRVTADKRKRRSIRSSDMHENSNFDVRQFLSDLNSSDSPNNSVNSPSHNIEDHTEPAHEDAFDVKKFLKDLKVLNDSSNKDSTTSSVIVECVNSCEVIGDHESTQIFKDGCNMEETKVIPNTIMVGHDASGVNNTRYDANKNSDDSIYNRTGQDDYTHIYTSQDVEQTQCVGRILQTMPTLLENSHENSSHCASILHSTVNTNDDRTKIYACDNMEQTAVVTTVFSDNMFVFEPHSSCNGEIGDSAIGLLRENEEQSQKNVHDSVIASSHEIGNQNRINMVDDTQCVTTMMEFTECLPGVGLEENNKHTDQYKQSDVDKRHFFPMTETRSDYSESTNMTECSLDKTQKSVASFCYTDQSRRRTLSGNDMEETECLTQHITDHQLLAKSTYSRRKHVPAYDKENVNHIYVHGDTSSLLDETRFISPQKTHEVSISFDNNSPPRMGIETDIVHVLPNDVMSNDVVSNIAINNLSRIGNDKHTVNSKHSKRLSDMELTNVIGNGVFYPTETQRRSLHSNETINFKLSNNETDAMEMTRCYTTNLNVLLPKPVDDEDLGPTKLDGEKENEKIVRSLSETVCFDVSVDYGNASVFVRGSQSESEDNVGTCVPVSDGTSSIKTNIGENDRVGNHADDVSDENCRAKHLSIEDPGILNQNPYTDNSTSSSNRTDICEKYLNVENQVDNYRLNSSSSIMASQNTNMDDISEPSDSQVTGTMKAGVKRQWVRGSTIDVSRLRGPLYAASTNRLISKVKHMDTLIAKTKLQSYSGDPWSLCVSPVRKKTKSDSDAVLKNRDDYERIYEDVAYREMLNGNQQTGGSMGGDMVGDMCVDIGRKEVSEDIVSSYEGSHDNQQLIVTNKIFEAETGTCETNKGVFGDEESEKVNENQLSISRSTLKTGEKSSPFFDDTQTILTTNENQLAIEKNLCNTQQSGNVCTESNVAGINLQNNVTNSEFEISGIYHLDPTGEILPSRTSSTFVVAPSRDAACLDETIETAAISTVSSGNNTSIVSAKPLVQNSTYMVPNSEVNQSMPLNLQSNTYVVKNSQDAEDVTKIPHCIDSTFTMKETQDKSHANDTNSCRPDPRPDSTYVASRLHISLLTDDPHTMESGILDVQPPDIMASSYFDESCRIDVDTSRLPIVESCNTEQFHMMDVDTLDVNDGGDLLSDVTITVPAVEVHVDQQHCSRSILGEMEMETEDNHVHPMSAINNIEVVEVVESEDENIPVNNVAEIEQGDEATEVESEVAQLPSKVDRLSTADWQPPPMSDKLQLLLARAEEIMANDRARKAAALEAESQKMEMEQKKREEIEEIKRLEKRLFDATMNRLDNLNIEPGWILERVDHNSERFLFLDETIAMNVTYNHDRDIVDLEFQSGLDEDKADEYCVLCHCMYVSTIKSTNLKETYTTESQLPLLLDYLTSQATKHKALVDEIETISDRYEATSADVIDNKLVRLKLINSDTIRKVIIELTLQPAHYHTRVMPLSVIYTFGVSEANVVSCIESVEPGERYISRIVEALRSII